MQLNSAAGVIWSATFRRMHIGLSDCRHRLWVSVGHCCLVNLLSHLYWLPDRHRHHRLYHPRLSWFAHLERAKTFGQIFGDTANFIAVIAGLSAYNILSNLGSGWWHLGLVAGWLALLVGLSLHRRWLNLTENHIGQWIDEYGKRNWLLIGIVYPLKVAQNRRERASALASEIVGLMTILSVLAPTGAASATNVQIGSWVSFGLLILTAIVLLVYFYAIEILRPFLRIK